MNDSTRHNRGAVVKTRTKECHLLIHPCLVGCLTIPPCSRFVHPCRCRCVCWWRRGSGCRVGHDDEWHRLSCCCCCCCCCRRYGLFCRYQVRCVDRLVTQQTRTDRIVVWHHPTMLLLLLLPLLLLIVDTLWCVEHKQYQHYHGKIQGETKSVCPSSSLFLPGGLDNGHGCVKQVCVSVSIARLRSVSSSRIAQTRLWTEAGDCYVFTHLVHQGCRQLVRSSHVRKGQTWNVLVLKKSPPSTSVMAAFSGK